MVRLTGGALIAGVVVIVIALFTTGQIGSEPATVKEPLSPIPDQALWDGRALGSADAPVLVEVFEDFQCPACGVFSNQTQPQLVADYVVDGKVRFVYKDMAFLDGGAGDGESHKAAIAARCAGEQDRFWPYQKYLFANQKGENQGHFSDAFLLAIATRVELDTEAFTSCTRDGAQLDAVREETREGKQRGVSGTPTVFVNGEELGFPAYQDLKSKIDGLLGAGG